MSTVQDYIEAHRLENTTKKTAYDINVWKRFCSSIREVRELENISAGTLNVLLCKFFIDVKKKDGGVYKPASLSSFQRSIQRYLKGKNLSFNLFQDMELAKSREVLLVKNVSSLKRTLREIVHKRHDRFHPI